MAPIGNLRQRPVRRLTQLYAGLLLYGVSMALMIRSGLGLDPWDVFHQGLSRLTGLSFGTVTIAVGALVLLLWIPLRQRPGLGTVSNVLVIGLVVDATLALLPGGGPLAARAALLVAGIVANGVATALYLGARLGPGPRDGLMTGYVARRPGRSVRLVRTVIEITVLALGWLLGGTVGVGTVAYALTIGPLAQFFLPVFTVDLPPREPAAPEPAGPERDDRIAVSPEPDGHNVVEDPTMDCGQPR
ncbi:YitT family protein [Micromonospora sp. NPDC020750]|uniref:membrane protein YczE n=1 Tax=unclassified Micromonospora TaxID=2617518 RepID=UPI0037AC4CD1